MNPLHPDDPAREKSEYANSAMDTALRLFRQLAKQGPPKVPEHEGPISFVEMAEEFKPYEAYYNSLIVFDPERNVVIIPFGGLPEIDLDKVNGGQDLLLYVLAILGRTPFDWKDEDWNAPFFATRLAERIAEIKGWDWIKEYHFLD
jgi:hypothetical protein